MLIVPAIARATETDAHRRAPSLDRGCRLGRGRRAGGWLALRRRLCRRARLRAAREACRNHSDREQCQGYRCAPVHTVIRSNRTILARLPRGIKSAETGTPTGQHRSASEAVHHRIYDARRRKVVVRLAGFPRIPAGPVRAPSVCHISAHRSNRPEGRRQTGGWSTDHRPQTADQASRSGISGDRRAVDV